MVQMNAAVCSALDRDLRLLRIATTLLSPLRRSL
jgi:hypothetical protein